MIRSLPQLGDGGRGRGAAAWVPGGRRVRQGGPQCWGPQRGEDASPAAWVPFPRPPLAGYKPPAVLCAGRAAFSLQQCLNGTGPLPPRRLSVRLSVHPSIHPVAASRRVRPPWTPRSARTTTATARPPSTAWPTWSSTPPTSTSPWHSTLSGTTWRCPAWDASSWRSRTRSENTPRGCCASRRAVAAACCCRTSRSRSVMLGARRWRQWRRRCSWRSR